MQALRDGARRGRTVSVAREIWIIRHGETPGNAARIVQKPEVPLSERGRDQAERLASRLRGAGIERILSSDLKRARMTAEAVRLTTRAPLCLEPLLQERNFGDIRGTPYEELGDRNIFAHDYEPPGGESGPVFDARVDRAWASICSHAGEVEGRLSVVTHGLVCASLAERHLRCDGELPTGGWGNTSVTIVEGAPPWRLVRVNCTRHLDDRADGGGRV